VYYEQCDNIETAIMQEKRLKKWNRKWKIELIEKENPDWKDLYKDIL
jgi:putative endonuclease